MSRPLLAAAATTLLALPLLASAPAAAAMPSTSGLGSRAGVVVVDLRSGRTLLSRSGGTRRIPASVTKLFTVGAALERLGPGWAPRTRVLATGGPAVAGTWKGDLVLVGGGDPTLSRAALDALARQTVAALGATRLDGRVIADAGAFDDWQGGDRTRRSFDPDMGGRLGALVVDRGSGQDDPAQRAASLLRSALGAAGLRVTTALAKGAAPAGARQVAVVTGPELGQLAGATLGPSDNFYAEMLLKAAAARDGAEGACRLAAGLAPLPSVPPGPADAPCAQQAAGVAPASTAAGITLERQTLRPLLGYSPRLRDGSGLTRRNRVSPAEVARLLVKLNGRTAVAPVLRAALPQAGRTGTLKRRMRGTAAVGRCQAKTGTLNGVSALAGYCTTRRKRDVAFAILQNGLSIPRAHQFQDRFVAQLAARG
ncbi:D-alanyl-D-alanine carboxypeptidase [Patulibacter medicamentivorans]|uniref:D-alanyl-D-alanine carboxypeptidase n=1 Tax=Patulibacter medicamentivorans TaxID=1097667 RepID=H0E8S5_9ACTN|nr:D-alanyl-D-alanine carboxypeptidase [Patulibacter medicamentivorans]EHN09953.1 D-alanyl-D-alanine carboxypeptidase [Patulibacter medicamentivorans]